MMTLEYVVVCKHYGCAAFERGELWDNANENLAYFLVV